ncbi:MAG: hypothetical protein M0Z51_15900 [Propionibacterium sp.]|nr:hypothetical protein [Propionibacterium sp.]
MPGSSTAAGWPGPSAVAHSMVAIAYHMLTRDESYQDLGANLVPATQRGTAHPTSGRAPIERLGHNVTLDAAS